MQIIAQCPTCKNCWLLEAEFADRRVRCSACNKLFKVPDLNEVPKAAKIIKQTNSKVYVDQQGNMYG